MITSFIYGSKKFNYALLFEDRKNLEITVHPDTSVIIKAPLKTKKEKIETKLKKRAFWILKQQEYFNQFNPRTPCRQYIGGETHLYMGKQYRLKISENNIEKSVKLTRGYFHINCVNRNDTNAIKKMLDQWYLDKAQIQFQKSFEKCWLKFVEFDVQKPELKIKKMNKRWGSLLKKGVIILNRSLIKAPRECIDYVVIHELCHLVHHNHNRNFYKLLENILPNWKNKKHNLEITLK